MEEQRIPISAKLHERARHILAVEKAPPEIGRLRRVVAHFEFPAQIEKINAAFAGTDTLSIQKMGQFTATDIMKNVVNAAAWVLNNFTGRKLRLADGENMEPQVES